MHLKNKRKEKKILERKNAVQIRICLQNISLTSLKNRNQKTI